MTQYVYNHLVEKIPGLLSLEILMLGLAFKGTPETNDMRNSPSIDLAHLFLKQGKRIFGWDAVVENSTIADIFLQSEITMKPQVFLILNNHESNVDKLNAFLLNNNEKIWIFDPWRLIGDPKEILRFAPHGVTYVTLSNSEEFLPNE